MNNPSTEFVAGQTTYNIELTISVNLSNYQFHYSSLFHFLCLLFKFTIYLFLNVSYLEFLKSAGCQTLFLLRDDRLVIIMIIAVFLFFRCLLHRNLLINGNVSYLRIFDETNVAALIIQQTKRKCVYTRAFNKSCGLVYISASKKDID